MREKRIFSMNPDYKSLFDSYIKKISGRGSQKTGLCFFHNDTNESFSFNEDSGLWKCFTGCGEGNAYQFAEKVRVDPRPYITNTDQVSVPIIAPKTEELKYEDKKLIQTCHEYLISHYSELVDLPWDIKVVKKYYVGYHKDKKCFTFPHFNKDGKAINIKFHKSENGDPPYSISGHGQNRFYPHNITSSELVLCEGEKDAITLESNGFNPITVTTGAMSLPDDLSILEKVEKITIVLDNDEAGRKGSQKIAEAVKKRFPSMIVGIVNWDKELPNKYDVTDYFLTNKKEDFEELILTANEIKTEKKNSIGIIPVPEDFYSIVNTDRVRPKDFIDGILPKESICAIVSDAGVGKTLMALNWSIYLSSGESWCGHKIERPHKVLYFLAEGGIYNLDERIKKLSKHSIKPEKGYFYPFAVHPYDLLDPNDYSEIQGHLKIINPEIIIIDTFIKSHKNDENDNTGMQRVLDVIRGMITGKKRSAIICHHIGKSGKERGASSFKGDVDTMVRLDENASGIRTMSFKKIRNGEMIDPIRFSLNADTLIFEDESRSEIDKLISKLEPGKGYRMDDLIKLYSGSKSTFYDKEINKELKKLLKSDGKLLYKNSPESKVRSDSYLRTD
jgi:5S rRNA maturation endonuclease (ribonuclease M5)